MVRHLWPPGTPALRRERVTFIGSVVACWLGHFRSFRTSAANCRVNLQFVPSRRLWLLDRALQRLARAPRSLLASRFKARTAGPAHWPAAWKFDIPRATGPSDASPEVLCPFGTRWPRHAIRPCHRPDVSASAFGYALAAFASSARSFATRSSSRRRSSACGSFCVA